MCLAAFNGPGITEGVGKLEVVPTTHQTVLPSRATAAAGTSASKLVPGLKRRNYSNKATATLIATGMGKPVKV